MYYVHIKDDSESAVDSNSGSGSDSDLDLPPQRDVLRSSATSGQFYVYATTYIIATMCDL